MRTGRAAALVLVLSSLPACRTYGRAAEHLMDVRHPWHAYPTLVAGAVGCLPLAPFALGEAALFHDGDVSFRHGVFGPLMGLTGFVVACPVGCAFYVVGLPIEWACPLPEPSPRRKHSTQSNEEPTDETQAQPDGGT